MAVSRGCHSYGVGGNLNDIFSQIGAGRRHYMVAAANRLYKKR